MANSLITPRALRDAAILTVRQGKNPEWDNIILTTGWNIDYDGSYAVMVAYDRGDVERWRHTFKGTELISVSQGTLEGFANYLVKTWPDVFAPEPEPELNVQLKEEHEKLRKLLADLDEAAGAVTEQLAVISELMGKL